MNDKQDKFILTLVCALTVGLIVLFLTVKCTNTKCIGAAHKSKYYHKNTCNAFR